MNIYTHTSHHVRDAVRMTMVLSVGHLMLGALTMSMFASPAPAHALSCMQSGTAAEEIAQADMVFYGTVKEIDADENAEMVGDEDGTITFTVEEVFKGDVDSEVTLTLDSYATWYGMPEVGDEAVIYVTVFDVNEPLSMPLCGRSIIGHADVDVELTAVRDAVEESGNTGVPQNCHAYRGGATVVGGLGKPYHTMTHSLIMRAVCDNAHVTLELTMGQSERGYVTGYYTQGGTWTPFTYTGDTINGSWGRGAMSYTIERSKLDQQKPMYVLSYTCDRVDGQWQCGCIDETCSKSAWQIQKVDLPAVAAIDEDEMVACTMDAMQCPDGTYVGRVAPTCEFATCPGS